MFLIYLIYINQISGYVVTYKYLHCISKPIRSQYYISQQYLVVISEYSHSDFYISRMFCYAIKISANAWFSKILTNRKGETWLSWIQCSCIIMFTQPYTKQLLNRLKYCRCHSYLTYPNTTHDQGKQILKFQM